MMRSQSDGPSFDVTGIDHIVLRVIDLDSMIAFYRDVLGCTVEKSQTQIGLTQLRAGRSLIDLVTVHGKLGSAGGAAPGREGRNVDHFALAIEPYNEPTLRSFLDAHGVEHCCSDIRYGAEGDGPSLLVRDPEGNTVELKGRCDQRSI